MLLPQQEALRERLASQQWTHRVGELLMALLAPSLPAYPAQPRELSSSGSKQACEAGPSPAGQPCHPDQQGSSGCDQKQQDLAARPAGDAEQAVSLAPWPPLPPPRPVGCPPALALQGPLPRGLTSVSYLLEERSSGGSQASISVSDLLGRPSAPLPSQHRVAVGASEGAPAKAVSLDEQGLQRAASSRLHALVRLNSVDAVLLHQALSQFVHCL